MTAERYVVVVRHRELPERPVSRYVPAGRRAREGLAPGQSYKVYPSRQCDVAVVAVDPASSVAPTWDLVEKARRAPGPLPRVVKVWLDREAGTTRRSPHRVAIRQAQEMAELHNRDPRPADPVWVSRIAGSLALWIDDPVEAAAAALHVAACHPRLSEER